MSKRAAIDIGSNSVKLLVLEISADGAYQILHDEERVTGLASGVSQHGLLSQQAINDTLLVLRDYLEIVRRVGSESIRAVATSALRDASNAVQLTGPAKARFDLAIETISGAEEARLSRAAALREIPDDATLAPRPIVFFDVGGGSTELTLYRDGAVAADCSLQLGARRLADLGHAAQPVADGVRGEMQRIVREMYTAQAPQVEHGETPRLLGLGGTASSVVFIVRGLRGEPKGEPHLAVVTRAELSDLLARIHDLPLEHVKALPNLNPKRADTIYAGIMIIDELLAHYGVTEFTLVDRGLRFGLLLA